MSDSAATPGMSSRQFAGRILLTLTGGLLALVIMAGSAWWLVGRAGAYSALIEHTYAAEARISRLLSIIEQAETTRRGYLLDPNEEAWRRYEQSASQVSPTIRDVEDFLADNPRQQQRLAELRRPVDRLLGMMTEIMALAETGDRDRALALFRSGQEVRPMLEARRIVREMLAEEEQLLTRRSAEQAAYTRRLLAVVIAGAVLIALLAIGALWTIRRYAADLVRSQEALRRLNAGLEDQVSLRTADLTRANEEIQRFAYIVSHDLRSPLVNVMGFTSELEVSLKPLRELVEKAQASTPNLVSRDARLAVEQDVPEAIGFIRSSTQKMDRLINAILKLSREGRRNLTPEPIDMTALVRGAADSLRALADARGGEIVVEGELPPVTSDRLAVEQALSNLMENAVKYLSPKRPGRVTVRGRTEGARVVYEVEDNGRGIDPKDHERVFDLFRRAGAQDQPGEGIGLAHVRALVQRLGGQITLSSELDRGSTFRLFLPQTLNVPARAAA